MNAGPENGRLLMAALHYARQARKYDGAPSTAYRDACLDRMLEMQLAAELAPLPGFERGPESMARADEVAEILVQALRPDGA